MLLGWPQELLMVGISCCSAYPRMHFGPIGYVTVWSIADEEREFELQGTVHGLVT